MSKAGRFEHLVLPTGESLVWQGRPDAWSLARRVFHIRLVALYFAALVVARLAIGWSVGQTLHRSFVGAVQLAIVAGVALALLGGLAFLYSRTTRYSLTSRRLLIQFGAVLPMTLNIPLAQVASADVKAYGDGTGDVPLAVTSKERLAYLLLWPHARPWRLNRVEPMIRCVPDVARVATLLGNALRAAAGQPAEQIVTAMPQQPSIRTASAVATAM